MTSAAFDPELVEFTLHPEQATVSKVEIYKVGGGTRGRAYEGLWGYAATRDDQVLASGEDLYTGMPKTHQEAAQILLEIIDDRE